MLCRKQEETKVSTYKKVSYGSSGNDVKTLQEMLNNNGYSLDVDGNFGSKTQAAVKDYQKKNNLTVDGIVGSNTWGALTSNTAAQTPSETPAQQTGANTTAAATPKYEHKAYQPSDAVTQAEALLNQQMQQKPGAYQSNYQGQLNDIISQILNRDKFSYDLNSDALYQQYANQYSTQGRLASMDVMGQAAAMTGGYGNSYAQAVGQQTYQGYLQQLNDVIPELYQMALNQYNQEGQALYDQAALLGAQEEQEYGRYRDQVSDYYSQLQQLYNQYNAEREFNYDQYLNDQNLQYQKERDQVEDERWQKEYDFALQQYNDSQSSKGSSGGSGGSGGSTGGSGGGQYDNGGLTKAQIKEMQAWYGTDADGIWGNNSSKAADGRSVTEAWEYYQANKGKEPVLEEDAPTFKEIAMELNTIIANGNGKNSGEVTRYLNLALEAGYITRDQYKSLKNTFAPQGYAY
jgi:peptidoglycan hydrolase-like protein with peptidoglycan-binding domain